MAKDPCFSGVWHEGETHGQMVRIKGVECYMATPSTSFDKKVALLLLTDGFGLPLNNNKLLADSFARNGLYTVMPDLFDGDPAPINTLLWLNKNSWFKRHDAPAVVAILDKVFAGLKERGVETFAAVGYCFGAREAVKYAIDGTLKVVAVAHPSRLEYPADLEKLKRAGTPILFNGAEVDQSFGPEQQKMADEVFGSSPLYKRTFHAGCKHGFAVRGDISDPLVKKGKQEAFDAQVDWFKKHLT